jgi:hypothetical protein
VAYDIHIRTSDGGIQYPDAVSYTIDPASGILTVQVPVEDGESDDIHFSPSYWQQYVVDPRGEDPLGFDDEDDEDDEYEDDYDEEDEDE